MFLTNYAACDYRNDISRKYILRTPVGGLTPAPACSPMITIDLTGIDRLAAGYAKKAGAAGPIVARALNRAGDQATTALGRQLAKETGLGVSKVRGSVHARRASRSDLVYTIKVDGGAVPLSEFGARQQKKGVSARPWGIRRIFPGTFQGVAGARVFKRQGKARLPIQQLYGPDLAKEVERGQSLDVVAKTAQEAFSKRVAHEVARMIVK